MGIPGRVLVYSFVIHIHHGHCTLACIMSRVPV